MWCGLDFPQPLQNILGINLHQPSVLGNRNHGKWLLNSHKTSCQVLEPDLSVTLLQCPLTLAAAVSQASLTHQGNYLKITSKFWCENAKELHPVATVKLGNNTMAPADNFSLASLATTCLIFWRRQAEVRSSFGSLDADLDRSAWLARAFEASKEAGDGQNNSPVEEDYMCAVEPVVDTTKVCLLCWGRTQDVPVLSTWRGPWISTSVQAMCVSTQLDVLKKKKHLKKTNSNCIFF